MKKSINIKIKRWLSVVAVCGAVAIGYNAFTTTSYAYTESSGTINGGIVQVRKEPVTGAKITSLSEGTTVRVIDEVNGSDGYIWYKVQFTYGNKTYEGYVRSDLITLITEDAANTGNTMDASQAGATGTVYNTEQGVNVRTGAGTSYSYIIQVAKGQTVTVLGQQTTNGVVWYNVSFTLNGTSYTGWICGDYLSVTGLPASPDSSAGATTTVTDEEYVTSLKAAGFPESYCNSLLALHQKYPNWQFTPVSTGLDWATVISMESANGKNLVSASLNDARKSTAAGAYDWASNTWYGYDGANWVCASGDYIAYCMDPRNFLNETNIFQFETLEYEPYQNTAGIKNVLAGTFMSGNYADTDGVTKSYTDTFMEVGKNLSVSPYHLAARCKQEQGLKLTSPLIKGTYSGYEGYFNYFNINAYTTSAASSTVNGLAYAKTVGWNTIYKSIQGGATIVADRYVKKGQNTLYFEKFNVVNASNLYSHQYMTNVMAAITEGASISSGYTDKTQGFIFRIPVYKNMPESAVTFTDTGNPNNWLSAMTVSGYNLTPSFNGAVTEYSLIVADGVNSVTVGATAVTAKSTVTGTGSYSLNYGTNTINVTCISQSGAARTYTLTVVRQQAENTVTPPSVTGGITVADGASISTSYVIGTNATGVTPGTSAVDLVKNISVNNCTVKVLKADGTENTGTVGTGNQIAVYVNGNIVKQYPVVIYGDINGDGKISNVDLVMMLKQILGLNSLAGPYLEAANTSKDGGVTVKDLVILQKHILNVSQISQ